MISKRRIYISAPADENLDFDQFAIKRAILRAIENEGFEPQEFFKSGIPKTLAWRFETADQVMSRCQGAAILAFARWRHAFSHSGLVLVCGAKWLNPLEKPIRSQQLSV